MRISSSGQAALPWVVAVMAGVLSSSAQEEVEVTPATTEAGEFQLTVDAPAGELLIEWTADLATWTPLVPLGTDGTSVQATDVADLATKFYRVFSFPDTDDTHLNGPVAQALQSAVAYSDLQSVFGLGAGPPASPVTLVRDLPTAGRDERLYAAAIGLLSVMALDLQGSVVPTPTAAELATAFAADLASGSLDGRDSGGSLIQIGTSASFLPEWTQQDLANAVASLDSELSGLRNALLSPDGSGQFSASVPSDWNEFYWDSAEWQ